MQGLIYEIEIKKIEIFSKTQLKINFLNNINSPFINKIPPKFTT